MSTASNLARRLVRGDFELDSFCCSCDVAEEDLYRAKDAGCRRGGRVTVRGGG